MRLVRPVVAASVAVVAAVTLNGASAATASNTVVLEDTVGDANFLNSQILVNDPSGAGTATPGSQAGNDITKVEFASTFAPPKSKKAKPVCNGFTITWNLSGPPTSNSRYRMSAATAVNDNFFLFDYDTAIGTTEIRYGGGSDDTTIDATVPAKVEGSKITFTVTETDLKAIGETLKSVVLAPTASSTVSVQGLLYFPIYDKVPAGKDFTICA